MTLNEKREASLAELLACLRQIVTDETTTLNTAKWLAASALRTVQIISQEGRIPSVEETKEWLTQQGWAFTN